MPAPGGIINWMKTHETVMAWVTEELSSGRLVIGDRLPGERALAERLGVSRSSLREALRVLEMLGTIRTATGSGPHAGTVITSAPEQALALALDLQLATSQVGYDHIYEMRLLLECWAAEHSDPARGDWEAVAELLERMDDPGIPVEDFLLADAELHALIAQTAGNPLVSTTMTALRSSIADRTLQRARSLPDWRGTAERLRREHRDIVAALRDDDRQGSVELLRAHIRGYYLETGHAS